MQFERATYPMLFYTYSNTNFLHSRLPNRRRLNLF